MNTKFTTDGHTVWLKKQAVFTMIANQTDRDGADELVILSGEEKDPMILKLREELPYFCKSNGIGEGYQPSPRPASYFQHLNKLR